MLRIRFYDRPIENEKLVFAIIVARSFGKWVLCRHRDRTTLEFPGGHREPGENILDAARRELSEETGALDYSIRPLTAYSVTGSTPVNEDGEEMFGMLFFAEIRTFAPELRFEIKEILLLDVLPDNWTYPDIQPKLLERVLPMIEPKRYDKLVRDRIPEIIERGGRSCRARTLGDAEYLPALRAKLREEVAEYEESGALEELADILEVVRALAIAGGNSPADLEDARARKAAERGGFEKKLLLISVEG